jgi:TnpA family transposase
VPRRATGDGRHPKTFTMVDVINQYVRFPLPRHWGGGRTAIADGTHVKLRENNLIGSRHIRYGGYGGIAYHHIADTYITLFPASFPAVYGRPFTSWMA